MTITAPTTTGSVTQSQCGGSYTWPANGVTYSASTTQTVVTGCNTATLNLTITAPTTTGSATATACSSYTWTLASGGNGNTYTASGVYTFVTGCNTATLTLTVNTAFTNYYADTDGDGVGAGTATPFCGAPDAGYVLTSTDCAPTDNTRWRTATLYVDADGDGYNNGFPSTSVCYGASIPTGFTATNIGTDCNDTNAEINPNHVEVLANGIDDNCDGTVDEVTPTSNLNSQYCGATLTSLSNVIFAYQLTSYPELGTIQGYRFEVTNGASVRTYDSAVNSFTLLNLAGGATYATTYVVRVSAKSAGFWRAYGAPCSVTTPAVPDTTSISSPSCGSTLTDISNTIFCYPVASATGYRFRVRSGATVVGTFETTVSRFNLVNLGISNIAFATTYSIDVLLKFGTTWRPDTEYGSVCSITTPATPGVSRVISPACGSTINALWTTIFAQQVTGAQGYRFVVTNGAQTRQFDTPNSRFSLMNLAGGAVAGTAYTIRVDVLYASSYTQGTQTCVITTSAGATRATHTALDIFEVKAYPNPFAENFKLDINTSSEDQVGVKVFDMLGREVEVRQSNLATMTTLEIGDRYPTGVYNIVVTQGDHVKSMRVIKR